MSLYLVLLDVAQEEGPGPLQPIISSLSVSPTLRRCTSAERRYPRFEGKCSYFTWYMQEKARSFNKCYYFGQKMGALRHTINKAAACPGHDYRAPMGTYSSWIRNSLRYVKPPPRAPATAARMALMSSNHHLNDCFIASIV